MGLTNHTVTELVPGDEVGEVTLDGGTPDSRFTYVVDDSRFEVQGTTLKLLDDQSVLRSQAEEIQIVITAIDSHGEFDSVNETFVIVVLENQTPAHNHDNPFDVNHQDDVTALDALVIINYLNAFGPGPVGEGDVGYCYDVNADGFVTALDALLVVNQINLTDNTGGVGGEGDGGAEGEHTPAPIAPEQLSPPQPGPPTQLRAGSLRLVDDQPETLSPARTTSEEPSIDQADQRSSLIQQIAKHIDPPITNDQLADLEETIRLLSARDA